MSQHCHNRITTRPGAVSLWRLQWVDVFVLKGVQSELFEYRMLSLTRYTGRFLRARRAIFRVGRVGLPGRTWFLENDTLPAPSICAALSKLYDVPRVCIVRYTR